LTQALSKRLDGEVELQELRLQAFPRLKAEGSGLTIRHHGRRDVPPLISIAHFSAEGTTLALARGHVARVTLPGLDIEIPPDRNRESGVAGHAGGQHAREGEAEADETKDGDGEGPGWQRDFMRSVVIDDLSSTGARLVIIPKEAEKPAKVWSIYDLHMT